MGSAPIPQPVDGVMPVAVAAMPYPEWIEVLEWRTDDGTPLGVSTPGWKPLLLKASSIVSVREGYPISDGAGVQPITLIDAGNPWGITPHRVLGRYQDWRAALQSGCREFKAIEQINP